jgi:hypothetical protein
MWASVYLVFLGLISELGWGDIYKCIAQNESLISRSHRECVIGGLFAKTSKALKQINSDQDLECTPYTILQESSDLKTLKKICSDPAKFVCGKSDAQVWTSDCELNFPNPKDVLNTPAGIDFKCQFAEFKKNFVNFHKSDCPAGEEESQFCSDLITAKYAEPLAEAEQSIAYTEKRITTVKQAVEKVKDAYLRMFENSKQLSADKKKYLKNIIQSVSVNLPPPKEDREPCTNTLPSGPDTGIFHNAESNSINFCIGAIILLEHMNPADLLHVIGHELAHAFDPCALESNFNNGNLAIRNLNNYREVTPAFFGELVPCLLGGKGADACRKGILHCNSKEGLKAFCDSVSLNSTEYSEGRTRASLFEGCLKIVSEHPNCSFGDSNDNYDLMDLSDFRKGKFPQSQVAEAFSDFMASEVLGQMTLDKAGPAPHSVRDKINGLTAISSVLARLHGWCLKENTNDPHPPSYLRINRVVMSSKRFRDGFCGENTKPPDSKFANLTCKGF